MKNENKELVKVILKEENDGFKHNDELNSEQTSDEPPAKKTHIDSEQ